MHIVKAWNNNFPPTLVMSPPTLFPMKNSDHTVQTWPLAPLRQFDYWVLSRCSGDFGLLGFNAELPQVSNYAELQYGRDIKRDEFSKMRQTSELCCLCNSITFKGVESVTVSRVEQCCTLKKKEVGILLLLLQLLLFLNNNNYCCCYSFSVRTLRKWRSM